MGDSNTPSTLERQFPRIIEAIVLEWGRPTLNRYLDRLMIDDRGDRVGFPEEILSEIMLLKLINESLTAVHSRPDNHTVWADPEYARQDTSSHKE
jgi:hypothetical protein